MSVSAANKDPFMERLHNLAQAISYIDDYGSLEGATGADMVKAQLRLILEAERRGDHVPHVDAGPLIKKLEAVEPAKMEASDLYNLINSCIAELKIMTIYRKALDKQRARLLRCDEIEERHRVLEDWVRAKHADAELHRSRPGSRPKRVSQRVLVEEVEVILRPEDAVRAS